MERNEAKQLVVRAGRELVRAGLVARTWGNVSCRIDGETFAVTPSGREYHSLTAEDIVEVKIGDLSYEGPVKPSSEKGIHAAVYRLFPDANFVIHTHQENASALSAARLDYFRPSRSFSQLGRTVVCAKYALPGTKSLMGNVSEALKISSSHAVILKHHGALCFGESCEDAFETANQLELASLSYINEHGGQLQASGLPETQQPQEPKLPKTQLTRDAQPPSGEALPYPAEFQALQAAWKASGREGLLLINNDPHVVRYSARGSAMRPLLDDFAQIVGTRIKTVKNDPPSILSALNAASAVMVKDLGAVCWGENQGDAEAVSMILRKNCKAWFAASAFGRPHHIKPWECVLMRRVYQKKYSKMDEKNRT